MNSIPSEFIGSLKRVGIASVVEGDGEVGALPVLIRRVVFALDTSVILDLPRPWRHSSGSIMKPGGIERSVCAVAKQYPEHYILVFIDCEDDCPSDLALKLQSRVRKARADLSVSVVLAYREYETWFVATADSFAGTRGFPPDLKPPLNPEGIRDAKGWLSRQMKGTMTYGPTQDQAALTELFDLQLARERSRSFRKLWKEIEGMIV